MSTSFAEWIEAMRTKRQWWVDASHENGFERGLWSTTVEKYADPSHFIFELLQNAEDAGATAVRFELLPDRIIFEHDGRAFNREDIDGITGIGNTTKLDEGHQIGCFGIGFKSVYVVTDRPEVHSEIEGEARAFAIDDLVVPRLVDPEPLGLGTRFILPLRPDKSAATLDHARSRLISSGAGALLFLEHIKSLAWVEGTSVGRVDVADSGDIRSVRSVQPNAADTREILLNVIGRFLLAEARAGVFRTSPLVVFLDEAHQFLGRSVGDEHSSVKLDSFGLIAKEGRKYGLTCVLATQRPRDIPQDVMSQLGTLFVHRLTNDQDRETVERACGDLDRGAAQFVPMLAPGEAVVIGPDIPAPVPLFIHPPQYPPDSKGPEFQSFWRGRRERAAAAAALRAVPAPPFPAPPAPAAVVPPPPPPRPPAVPAPPVPVPPAPAPPAAVAVVPHPPPIQPAKPQSADDLDDEVPF